MERECEKRVSAGPNVGLAEGNDNGKSRAKLDRTFRTEKWCDTNKHIRAVFVVSSGGWANLNSQVSPDTGGACLEPGL
jgi:hypothetical protein